MTTQRSPKRPGRPREFDPEQALERAMCVFWKKGYEGTSLPDLTEAMGINRPSLYAAFGNKESLFRKALDRYVARANTFLHECLALPTALEGVERLLRGSAGHCGPGKLRGCLLVQGALTCGEESEPIRQELVRRRSATEKALKHRFERAVRDGELPGSCDAASLARYFATVLQGLAVQAASGASPADLVQVVEIALHAWPR